MGQVFPPISGSAGGGTREVLAANRTYYVNPSSGNDSNDGLSPGAGAFATIQKAADTVTALDLSIYDATIQLEDDTYLITDADRVILGPYVTGGGLAKLVGNPTTPTNVLLRAEAGFTLTHTSNEAMVVVQGGANWGLGDFAVSNLNSVSATTINVGVLAKDSSQISLIGDLVFNGASATVTMQCLKAQNLSGITIPSPHVVTFDSDPGGVNQFQIGTVASGLSTIDFLFGAGSGDITFAANNSFSFGFIVLRELSNARTLSVAYTGTLTASNRYDCQGNTSINDGGNVPAGTASDVLVNGAEVY